MTGIEARSFQEPDETVRFEHGHIDLVKVSSLAIGREVLEPGWRWSIHVKPIVGTECCEFHHVLFRSRSLGGRPRAQKATLTLGASLITVLATVWVAT